MKRYTLETCHANDLVQDAWKVVDEISSIKSLNDHLASPSFDWHPGLCVRVRSKGTIVMYSGIFNDHHVVDVGPASQVMAKFPMDASDQSMNFSENLSALQCWSKSHSGSWLFQWLGPVLTRAECAKVCYELIKTVHPYYSFNYQASRQMIEAVAVWIEYQDNNDEIRECIYKSSIVEVSAIVDAGEVCIQKDHNLMIAYAAQCALDTVTAMINSCKVTAPQASQIVVDIVRNNLPFHEIALRLIA